MIGVSKTIAMDNNINNLPEYLIKESEYLRKIYEDFRKETKALEKYTLLAIGGIWSWCIANYTSNNNIYYLTWLPVIIVSLLGFRAFGIYMQMKTVKKYLIRLESSINGMPKEIGWERFLLNEPLRVIWPLTAFMFWITLTILTIVAPSVFLKILV